MDLVADSDMSQRRRSTREIKVKKFDDDMVTDLRGTPRKNNPPPTASQSLSRPLDSTSPSSVRQSPAQSTHSSLAPTPTQGSGDSPLASPAISTASTGATKKSGGQASGKKRSRADETKQMNNARPAPQQMRAAAVEDHGRWTAEDDVSLIAAVMQSNDLRKTHMMTKFSCNFTLEEVSVRWYALMYDPTISKLAMDAMRSLPTETIQKIQSRTLFSKREEALLAAVPSVPPSAVGAQAASTTPSLLTFTELLEKNADVFHEARTAASLQRHWVQMRHYRLLNEQRGVNAQTSITADSSLAEIEESLDVEPDPTVVDPIMESEMFLSERRLQQNIRVAESELQQWPVLTESITGQHAPDFNQQTLATLRGRLVRYLMQGPTVTLGRGNRRYPVDVDLSLDGPAFKVSRRQAVIRLNRNSEFLITNEGRTPMFIDGQPLQQGERVRLDDESIIEVGQIRLVFLSNPDLMGRLRQDAYKPQNASYHLTTTA